MRILIVDNFDSFTYNLYHYVDQFASSVEVIRYDKGIIKRASNFDKIIISPGPGLPKDYPVLEELILKYSKSKSILGICLGLQTIAESYGCSLKNLDRVNHGIGKITYQTKVKDDIFNNIPEEFISARYHSWVIDDLTMNENLAITAVDDLGHIMAVKHSIFDVRAVQFHPESVLTPHGLQMIKNWVNK